MRARQQTLMALAVALLMAAPAATAAPHERGLPQSRLASLLPEPEACDAIPGELPPIPAETARELPLRILYLVERRDLHRARALAAATVRDFGKIGIKVTPSYDAPSSFRVKPDVDDTNAHPNTLFKAMRERYGGSRPKNVDVVYLFTRQWPSGQASCINGILRADQAFALGPVEGGATQPDRLQYLATHETGHLLGARHEDANCAESIGSTTSGSPGCTVMFPSNRLMTGTFSTMETAFMRHTLGRHVAGRPS
jgi:hypothetical protein